MKGMPDMPMGERDWQAENDADHLMRANCIKSDPDRMKRAKDAAKMRADRMEEEAKNMRKAARGMSGGSAPRGGGYVPDDIRRMALKP